MLTKSLIITGLSVSAIGSAGLILAPQNPVDSVAISAGPATVNFGGEQALELQPSTEINPGVIVTLKSGRQISLTL